MDASTPPRFPASPIETNHRKASDGMTCSVSAKAMSEANSFSVKRTVNRILRVYAPLYLGRRFRRNTPAVIRRGFRHERGDNKKGVLTP